MNNKLAYLLSVLPSYSVSPGPSVGCIIFSLEVILSFLPFKKFSYCKVSFSFIFPCYISFKLLTCQNSSLV